MASPLASSAALPKLPGYVPSNVIKSAPIVDTLSRSQLMQPLLSEPARSVSVFAQLPVTQTMDAKRSFDTMLDLNSYGSIARTISPFSLSDSSDPQAAGSNRWRTLPPLSGASMPPVPSNAESSSESALSIHDILDAANGLGDRATGPQQLIRRHGSPSFQGVDPKQLEAALPMPIPDTLDNILKAYFKYQFPSAGIVLEEFFWYRYRRNMLTPLIIYAMLAIAAWNLASEDKCEKYGNMHEMFYRQAKQFVEDAMDEAHLRSVQGLLVLANYETLVGRWGSMWNHTTMARRLAEGDFPWPGVQHSEFDFEFQRVQRAYWHSLINDIWSSVLMDKQIGGILIRLPEPPSYDFTYRNVRLLHSDEAPGYRVAMGPDALTDPRWGNTAALGELFLLVGEVNNKAPSFKSFIDFEMRLTSWYLKLPQNVRLDDSTIARFTATAQRADLGEIISTHMMWNFARLMLMKMGLAFYNTDSRALQFYQSSMPILTPDRAASYDEWLFHFCRCMSLQSVQNIVNLLRLGETHGVHPGHFGASINLPMVHVVSVSLGLVHSPDPQVVRIAVEHLTTVIRTLLRLKHWFNTAHLLLHLFLAMQDPQLVLPRCSYTSAEDTQIRDATDTIRVYKAIEVTCPFPPSHLITELMRRLNITFEEFVKETIRAVRVSSPTKSRIDPCISPLLRHLPEASHLAMIGQDQEPEWFRYAPSYLRSAWKRLGRTYTNGAKREGESSASSTHGTNSRKEKTQQEMSASDSTTVGSTTLGNGSSSHSSEPPQSSTTS
ncbi:hypothetical protein DL89DRAFT_268352 [Linderina pennispora]|uniref:Xylanolytic transcriptional activator regulatory domain-containing protein n=1 Tax=Linderina pennispora TaxID=61395 RepID=A0A1Y1W4N8_9FUNG|nr:uncharacterized protein DL89DRAFT_268352 [Linderina pennispora]ORX68530.1 hypothetical protein DL89DRAFT_268352 [Linderina pennispora]